MCDFYKWRLKVNIPRNFELVSDDNNFFWYKNNNHVKTLAIYYGFRENMAMSYFRFKDLPYNLKLMNYSAEENNYKLMYKLFVHSTKFIDDDDILVGYSLGGVLASHIKKGKALIAISPFRTSRDICDEYPKNFNLVFKKQKRKNLVIQSQNENVFKSDFSDRKDLNCIVKNCCHNFKMHEEIINFIETI